MNDNQEDKITPKPKKRRRNRRRKKKPQQDNALTVSKTSETVLSPTAMREKYGDAAWVQMIGHNIDPQKGIQIDLDWNEAFVTELRSHGYKGTDDQVIHMWLTYLYRDIVENYNPKEDVNYV